MRQEYFAAYGENANQHKIEIILGNFRTKQKKILIHNHHTEHDRMGKKTISRYCPFNGIFCAFLQTTEYTELKPLLSGVHSVMRVKSVLAGEGGGCTTTPSHYIYPHQ
jgi:hypothetical protein